ncbi:hypothetical protein [Flavobacterium silvaticum]|uniref:Lipocalin-like domain-containing protein n=1 Tax=Flavobacterium silvaticum TaxID=1852020 RepID=A0A972JGY3_9FLAO|nr:hypothetical protein [Flavobacterium silvaticum]NMH28676.1 hypothetical protein [Flavobacterium silvaticum]
MKKYDVYAFANSIRLMAATALFGLSAIFVGCGDDDATAVSPNIPTVASFNALRQTALESRTQHFDFVANGTSVTVTSEKGVTITINTSCLTLNGASVTGNLDLDFVEIFDGGDMAVTNKTTRGVNADGDLAMLVSGGEFFIGVYKDGQKVDVSCGINIVVPANLSGGVDQDMTLWNAVESDTLATPDVIWNPIVPTPQGNFLNNEGSFYFAFLQDFGWVNCDRFYSFTGPKTTILVDVPEIYNNQNCSVYLSYDGEGSALANLDHYTTDGYFSEHYGQVPVGLACHVIFISEDNGNYRYAIKPVTISEGDIVTISLSETVTGTEAQLVSAINAAQE